MPCSLRTVKRDLVKHLQCWENPNSVSKGYYLGHWNNSWIQIPYTNWNSLQWRHLVITWPKLNCLISIVPTIKHRFGMIKREILHKKWIKPFGKRSLISIPHILLFDCAGSEGESAFTEEFK